MDAAAAAAATRFRLLVGSFRRKFDLARALFAWWAKLVQKKKKKKKNREMQT